MKSRLIKYKINTLTNEIKKKDPLFSPKKRRNHFLSITESWIIYLISLSCISSGHNIQVKNLNVSGL